MTTKPVQSDAPKKRRSPSTGRGSPEWRAERYKLIIAALQKGFPVRFACAAAHIVPDTFYVWLEQGAKDIADNKDTEFSHFYWDASDARLAGMEKHLGGVEAKEKNWQADAWWLERLFPEEFGRRSAVALTNDGDSPLTVLLTHVEDWNGQPEPKQADKVKVAEDEKDAQ